MLLMMPLCCSFMHVAPDCAYGACHLLLLLACVDKKERDPTFRKQPQDVAASKCRSSCCKGCISFFLQLYYTALLGACRAWLQHGCMRHALSFFRISHVQAHWASQQQVQNPPQRYQNM